MPVVLNEQKDKNIAENRKPNDHKFIDTQKVGKPSKLKTDIKEAKPGKKDQSDPLWLQQNENIDVTQAHEAKDNKNINQKSGAPTEQVKHPPVNFPRIKVVPQPFHNRELVNKPDKGKKKPQHQKPKIAVKKLDEIKKKKIERAPYKSNRKYKTDYSYLINSYKRAIKGQDLTIITDKNLAWTLHRNFKKITNLADLYYLAERYSLTHEEQLIRKEYRNYVRQYQRRVYPQLRKLFVSDSNKSFNKKKNIKKTYFFLDEQNSRIMEIKEHPLTSKKGQLWFEKNMTKRMSKLRFEQVKFFESYIANKFDVLKYTNPEDGALVKSKK